MESLTSEELFHLGLHSLDKDDIEKSLSLFKRCVELDSGHAKAVYMVGALYAQIQMVEPAVEWLGRAIELDGSEKTAVFQLGLLHLTSGAIEMAKSVWEGLADLPGEHPFKLFADGMSALVEDNFAQCIEKLEQGIEKNNFNTALNNDMRRVIDSATVAMESQPVEKVIEQSESVPSKTNTHIALSGYRQSLKKH